MPIVRGLDMSLASRLMRRLVNQCRPWRWATNLY